MFETLEGRRLFTVSVVALPNHGLLVRGSPGDDHVAIDQEKHVDPETGQHVDYVQVVDLGTNTPVTPSPIQGVNYIIVDLGAGDDQLIFHGENSAAAIVTGSGDDTVEIQAFGTEQVVAELGSGTNYLSVLAINDSTVIARNGPGDDSADLVALDNASIVYSAGAGADTVSITNIGATSKIIVNGGAGNDTINVFVSVVADNTIINGGPGYDTTTGAIGSATLISVENPG